MISPAQSPLGRLEALRVVDVMARHVTTIPWSATMDEAAATLRARGISGAPVVDDRGRCVGVLSATDFLRYDLREGESEVTLQDLGDECVWEHPWNSVQRHMSAPAQFVAPGVALTAAAETMCSRNIHRLIVLDESRAPVGVVSTLDVVSALVQAEEEFRQGRGCSGSRRRRS